MATETNFTGTTGNVEGVQQPQQDSSQSIVHRKLCDQESSDGEPNSPELNASEPNDRKTRRNDQAADQLAEKVSGTDKELYLELTEFQQLEAILQDDLVYRKKNFQAWTLISLIVFMASIPWALYFSLCWGRANIGVHFQIWSPVLLSAIVLIWFVSSAYGEDSESP